MTLDLLDCDAVAELCGVRPETVNTWRFRGVLPEPDVVLGRSPGWHRETILRWRDGRQAGKRTVTSGHDPTWERPNPDMYPGQEA